MTPLTQKIIQKIREDHIVPTPMWRFSVRHFFGWAGVVLLTLLASLMTSFSFHLILETDWDAYLMTDLSWIEIALMSLPFLWLFLLALFVAGALFLFARTGRGYRYPVFGVFLLFFTTSTALGFSIENSPLDEPLENFFLGSVSHTETFKALVPTPEKQWSQPEHGLLGGSVTSSDRASDTLELEDFEQQSWKVDYADADIKNTDTLEPDSRVKVIGTEGEDHEFRAHEIRSWKKSDDKKEEAQSSQEKNESVKATKDEEDDADVREEEERDEVEHEDEEEDEPEEEESEESEED